MTPWIVAHQTSRFMRFSRQEYWSELPLPSPGDHSNPGIQPGLLHWRHILYHLSQNRECPSIFNWPSVQLLSRVWLCNPMNCSMPGLPVHHQLPEFTQTHVHRVSDAIQLSHPLSSPSPSAPTPSQHHGLFQWVNSSHEVAKVLELQLQHQSFQWTPRTALL